MNREFLGVWIPKEVYLHPDLNWTDKILLIEIQSLDNEKGCFASNDYFSKFIGVTNTTISLSITKLKELGMVEQVHFDGRMRTLKVCVSTGLKSAFKKTKSLPLRNVKSSLQENLKDNNTVNNTVNNTYIIKEGSLSLDAWKLWKDYKKEQFKLIYKPIGEKAAISKLMKLSGGNHDVQMQIINQSIENGWKGFFELKQEKQSKIKQSLSTWQEARNKING